MKGVCKEQPQRLARFSSSMYLEAHKDVLIYSVGRNKYSLVKLQVGIHTTSNVLLGSYHDSDKSANSYSTRDKATLAMSVQKP